MQLFWGATSAPRVQAGTTAMAAKMLKIAFGMRSSVLDFSLKFSIRFLVQVKQVTPRLGVKEKMPNNSNFQSVREFWV